MIGTIMLAYWCVGVGTMLVPGVQLIGKYASTDSRVGLARTLFVIFIFAGAWPYNAWRHRR
jgi:hypothetical protein